MNKMLYMAKSLFCILICSVVPIAREAAWWVLSSPRQWQSVTHLRDSHLAGGRWRFTDEWQAWGRFYYRRVCQYYWIWRAIKIEYMNHIWTNDAGISRCNYEYKCKENIYTSQYTTEPFLYIIFNLCSEGNFKEWILCDSCNGCTYMVYDCGLNDPKIHYIHTFKTNLRNVLINATA